MSAAPLAWTTCRGEGKFRISLRQIVDVVVAVLLRCSANLVYQSAKDYLLSTRLQEKDSLLQYHIVLDMTNLLIFRTCWTYLSLKEFEQGTATIDRVDSKKLCENTLINEFLKDHCFLQYAIKEWQKHALAANPALATDYEFWKDTLHKLPTLRDYWLIQASAEGHEVIVQRLLEEGAELNSLDIDCLTPLSRAALRGHEAIVTLLLSQGDVIADFRDTWGQTPLHRAARRGYKAVVRLLVSRNDMIADSRDYELRTPLSLAAGEGHEAVVRLLLSRDDVAVDSRDPWGRTPLQKAVMSGHEAMVRLLLTRHDVAADSRDDNDRTPLSWAIETEHEAIVKLLLSRDDVAVDSRDGDGRTPLEDPNEDIKWGQPKTNAET